MTPLARTVIAVALLMHGLGMVGGGIWLAVSKGQRQGWGESWLLASTGPTLQSVIAILLWGVSGIAFISAAYAFWTSAPWFDTAIYVGAPTTLLAAVLWAGAVPFGTYIGAVFALAMLVAVLAGLL
jgi:hypothetical protein